MSYPSTNPPSVYGSKTLKGTSSMDSFVDFDYNGEQSTSHHKKGFSAFSLFRNRKKSSPDVRSAANPRPHPLSNVRSLTVESFDPGSLKASQTRALPPLPPRSPSDPTPASSHGQSLSAPASANPGEGVYGPMQLSPEPNGDVEFSPSRTDQGSSYSQNYEGLPNPYDTPSATTLHANHGPPASYPRRPPPENAVDAAIQRDGQAFVDNSRMLDREIAPQFFLAEGLKLNSAEHKQTMATIKKIAMHGTESMSAAEVALDAVAASPIWTEGKEIAQTLLEPAKDMVQLLDVLTPYVPLLVVAKFAFTTIVKKELERHENEKNMTVALSTITKFWYTLCDLNIVFKLGTNQHKNIEDLVNEVVAKMHEFGNFQRQVSTRTMKSGSYKTQITGFLTTFKDFQDQLQRLLGQVSALTINNVDKNVDQLNQKMNMLIAMINQQSPKEERVQARIQAYGGEEAVLQSPRLLNEITESEFGTKVSPQLKSILREDLASQLKANEEMFKLQLDVTKRDIELTINKSTDAILVQMESGPHELIYEEDIREIWKEMKWRLSCKTRHFVDALHQHYANKFSKHQKKTGERHQDHWTLKLIGRVVFQPAIGDAIDCDGSGYVSIDEVNRFTKNLPADWSIPIFMAHAAAGWYQNALVYRSQCMDYLHKIEHCAKRMLPQNRKRLRPYFQKGCLPEIWYIVDSLNTDTFRYQGEDLRLQFENLAKYRTEIMRQARERLQDHLVRVKYRIQSPEEIKAVTGTSRTEAVVLPTLSLLLERHMRIVETAANFVLAEREFEDMTTSMQSVAYAFAKRYSALTEGWRQQRFDIPSQVSFFSYGIFVSWHSHFSSNAFDQQYPNPHMHPEMLEPWSPAQNTQDTASKPPGPTKDLLNYALPVQPTPDELRQMRHSVRTNLRPEDSRAKERYGHTQRVKSKRLSRLGANGVPKSPTIRIDTSAEMLKPTTANRQQNSPSRSSPLRLKRPDSSSYHFEFEDTDGVLRAINGGNNSKPNDGYASADSSDWPDVPHTPKGQILTLDDRIRSVEQELNGMKSMLAQLLAISKTQDRQV